MVCFKRALRNAGIILALSGVASAVTAQEQPGLRLRVDYETAKLVSQAVRSGAFDQATAASICAKPSAAAMMKNMGVPDCDALLHHLRGLANDKKMLTAAVVVGTELARADGGKYGPLAAEITRQIKEYVPAQFNADISVHFIFGGYSNGFTPDEFPTNDVYINLAAVSEANPQELAELVAHELFHVVQTHVMHPDAVPAGRGEVAKTGPIWLNHLLLNLEQEGTAELFSHPLVLRPATPYSARRKQGIERNTKRIDELVTLFETLGWRLLQAPPADEDAYGNIYGLMFYPAFDETAYDLGWLMASTIVNKDGKLALFSLFKEDPKQFVLRYQSIAQADGKLPMFSEEFIQRVRAL